MKPREFNKNFSQIDGVRDEILGQQNENPELLELTFYSISLRVNSHCFAYFTVSLDGDITKELLVIRSRSGVL